MRRLMTLLVAGSILTASPLAARQPPRDPKPVPAEAPAKPAAEGQTFDEMLARVQAEAALTPDKPDGYYKVATLLEEKVRKDQTLTHGEKWTYILQAIDAADRALVADPDHMETLVYKNILLRHQAMLVPEEQRQPLIDQANLLRAHAIKRQKTRADVSGAPPMAPPDAPTRCRLMSADGMAPVRVGGNIKAPTKTADMRPVYPPEAQAAQVSGVVILEVLIDVAGLVSQACVLRSIPILDDAAIDAVKQWQFTPTFLDGAPVPVVMTVTVNFTLQ